MPVAAREEVPVVERRLVVTGLPIVAPGALFFPVTVL